MLSHLGTSRQVRAYIHTHTIYTNIHLSIFCTSYRHTANTSGDLQIRELFQHPSFAFSLSHHCCFCLFKSGTPCLYTTVLGPRSFHLRKGKKREPSNQRSGCHTWGHFTGQRTIEADMSKHILALYVSEISKVTQIEQPWVFFCQGKAINVRKWAEQSPSANLLRSSHLLSL